MKRTSLSILVVVVVIALGAPAAFATIVDHPVLARCLEVLVADVGEVEPTQAVAKIAVGLDGVVADRHDLCVEVLELGVVRPQGG